MDVNLVAADENGSLGTVTSDRSGGRNQGTKQRWESKCKSVPLHTLKFCIILDTEFSNMTVNNN